MSLGNYFSVLLFEDHCNDMVLEMFITMKS